MSGAPPTALAPVLTMTAMAAMVLAAAAGWLVGGNDAVRRVPRLLPAGKGSEAGAPPGGAGAGSWLVARRVAGLQLSPLLLVSVPLAVVAVRLTGSLVAGALVLAGGAAAGRAVRVRHRTGEEAALRRAVIELCTVLAAELRAGRSPRDALAWAAGAGGRLDRQVRPALDYGRDVPALLRDLSVQPGGHGLRRLAACWQVAEGSGAGLCSAVDRLAAGLRGDEAQRHEIAAQLAGPRATARLLAVLPLFGLLLAGGLGGDPVRILLHTPYGLACLVCGVALDVAGVVWTERIAAAAESSG